MSSERADHDAQDVYIGSIDQGTTSTRFIIFNKKGVQIASHQIEFKQIYHQSGWHEHDPLEIVRSVEECIEKAVAKFEEKGHAKTHIKAIGITNQRETTVVWDRKTGAPLYNAIVWTDTRNHAQIRTLKERPDSENLQNLSGLPLSTYPSAGKLLWLLENVPAVSEAYDHGTLASGTMDTWLIYNLNGGPTANIFVTDSTNASRTMFMDINTLSYSSTLLDFFQLDTSKIHLPRIITSSHPSAMGSLSSGPLKGVPITGCLGDQSAALVGQRCFSPGTAKNTYGTGCFLLCNVGSKPVISTHGLLATVAYDFGPRDSSSKGETTYALEGSIAAAGSSLKFLTENLRFGEKVEDIEALAADVGDSGGVVFVTGFSGLFAPYWIDDARGTIFGITQHTQRGHIARATLEAVCFQTRAILEAMEKDSGHTLTRLAVDGGMSRSDLCMQIQANILPQSMTLQRPRPRSTSGSGDHEMTALGAAIAAGLGAGIYGGIDEVEEVLGRGEGKDGGDGDGEEGNDDDDDGEGRGKDEGKVTFRAEIEQEDATRMWERWERAVGMCRGWVT